MTSKHEGWMPDLWRTERDPEMERQRAQLMQLDCTMYRQWGGNPACAIFLPANGGPQRIVVENYAEHPDRVTCRRAAYMRACEALGLSTASGV